MKPKAIINLRIRIPGDMHTKLKHNAIDNGRSLNSEIVFRLKCQMSDDSLILSLNKVRAKISEAMTLIDGG